MGILSKSNTTDKWKSKYFELLDENEIFEKSRKNSEDLLCKTIVRLSLASTGFNKDLDPYLLRIRKQLKKGLKSELLKVELENFSNALMTLNDSVSEDSVADASLLFEFLSQHFPEQKNEIQRIEVKFTKNEFPNAQYLFIAINDFIDSIQSISSLDNIAVSNIQNDAIDSKLVNTHLQHLLDNLDIPLQFESQAQKLKDQLYNNSAIDIALDETVSLLLNIKKHFHSEQQELAKFLAQLTEHLSELGKQASGAQSVTNSSLQNQKQLAQTVTSQVKDLQLSSKKETQLEPLKQLIHNRLAEIALHIEKHQVEEEIERIKVDQELESLTKRIKDMEKESVSLNDKLDVAHYRASHDPLTQLPNRLAYDERLETELARWKRYQSPLSIIIWDIDWFKNINDNFGHKAGDKTLILIAKLLSNYCRETDFVSRFGGEEFTMLLSDTDAQSACQTANKLRKVIEKTAFNSNGKKISITISCGITQFIQDDTGLSAFNRADAALYKAKNNGRNQCVIG